ncbi:LPS-assembly protein LptD, partial [Piscinibacter defluvii]|uniref:LPS-assembly protein LptD n=1 Tax=Piscinibacter defluvii TaxID=1796922 RepID=UPI00197C394D
MHRSRRPRPPCRWPLAPLALAAAAASAQGVEGPGLTLRRAESLAPLPRGDAGRQLPIVLRARELRGRPDLETVAEGEVEFRRGGTVLRADRLSYDFPEDLALARGHVRVSRDGNVYSGPELQLHVQRFEGWFLEPTYFFGRTGAGGTARRIDFIDEQRAVASGATYSSCSPDEEGGQAWVLSTERVKMDFEANEGIAENAVLRFQGVPILGAPVLSFPLTDERKSGWLPPSVNLDSKSGLQVSVPYYWNIAPNRDATITPLVSAKRGLGSELEFRFLEPRYAGTIATHLLPHDRLTGHSRRALNLEADSRPMDDLSVQLRTLRVSDDAYWKDFPRAVPSITPRLLASDLQASRVFGEATVYARVERWQVLQDEAARIEAPYQRSPQLGVRWLRGNGEGLAFGLEAEANHFVETSNGRADPSAAPRPTGTRTHALGSLAWSHATPGWTLTPKLSFNAASYSLDAPLADGRRRVSRVIPTLSLDSAWVLERDAHWFGRDVRQTLEPRLLYSRTPYRAQAGLPVFDTAGKDLNFDSIYTENQFSGVDRVSDAHQVTAGVTTRLLDPATGAETLRLGIAQRYLLRDQRITAQADGTPDGPELTQRFSDVLLLGSTHLVPRWTLDASLQYNSDTARMVRSIVGARYSPGPYRTVGATYRFARDLSEQVELGWQWPIYGATPAERAAAPGATSNGTNCRGSWFSVGRINYS